LKSTSLLLSLALLAAPLFAFAQTTVLSPYPPASGSNPQPSANVATVSTAKAGKKKAEPIKTFSRMAFSGGISAMGINMQVATNVNRFMNLRTTGNYLYFNDNNISASGFNLDAKLHFASAGASLDLYPFPNRGFRVSPGLLFHNDNTVNATMLATTGTSFSLGPARYYSSTTLPVTGVAGIGLNGRRPAFTITTGWGNAIPRSGNHWSFPVEVGVALVGVPTVKLALSGDVCANTSGSCVPVPITSVADYSTNLQAQIAKYQSDLKMIRYFPIASFGVAYNFRIR